MIIYISHHFFHYEAGNLCRMFFPYASLKQVENLDEFVDDDINVKAEIEDLGESLECKVYFKSFKKEITESLIIQNTSDEKVLEHNICKCLFKAFSKATENTPKWGMLTGIHPVKFFYQTIQSLGKAEAERIFREEYFVSEEKLELSNIIINTQQEALDKNGENDFSLYVSIPFCPSRCNYCSFVSQSIEKTKKLIPPYLKLLLKELEETAKIAKELGLRLLTVYIGGGTPTTLEADELKLLIDFIKNNFNMSNCFEFTVEAGRPDTITKEKLEVLESEDVLRISINPQSMNDRVLETIGRHHSAKLVSEMYKLARETGIKQINMDLIAGLEGDSFETFKESIDEIIELNPDNITVHSLALKRSADIFKDEKRLEYHSRIEEITKMVDYSVETLMKNGYLPYYLYKQSRSAANMENTGFAKANTQCAYNIYTMDESQTVIACGAGAVSKIKDPYSNRLERIFNFKYSYEYIDRFDEILNRKKEVIYHYEQFRKRVH